TPRYMSPEQAEGKRVDSRSDIFTFGVMLYEMVTGQLAFQGPTTLSTLTAVLRDEPKPIAEFTHDAPDELVNLISRCIRKEAAERYQRMGDVREALREIAGRPQITPSVETRPALSSRPADETVAITPAAPKAGTVAAAKPEATPAATPVPVRRQTDNADRRGGRPGGRLGRGVAAVRSTQTAGVEAGAASAKR